MTVAPQLAGSTDEAMTTDQETFQALLKEKLKEKKAAMKEKAAAAKEVGDASADLPPSSPTG